MATAEPARREETKSGLSASAQGRRSGTTLYDEIRGTLSREIAGGTLRPGDKLPTEVELAARFGASRPTVNKAIASLANDGLVVRRKRAGTVVLAQSSFWLPIVDISRYVADQGKAYAYQLLSTAVVQNGDGVADWPDVAVNTPLLALECLHLGGGVPVQHERRLINLEAVPAARAAAFDAAPPGPWLLRHVPWSASEHRIGAVGAGETLAHLFGVRRGTPCLGLHRTTRHRGRALTTVTLTSPAGRFFLEGAYAPLGDGE